MMDEWRISFVKGRVLAQAAAAQHRRAAGRDGGCFHYFAAAVTAQIVPGQMLITGMTNVPGLVSRIAAQDAGRRKQVILYNIEPVVYHFHLNRLTRLAIVFV